MILYFSIGLVLIILIPYLLTGFLCRSKIFESSQSPGAPVAIVFGAGLTRDGAPTAILKDRVVTAAELYFAGKAAKLLMSGDNRFVYYNEPQAMFDFARQLGIPAEDIVMDYAGRRTYDTCYRARDIFGVNQALLVTQEYHLPRAILTCGQLGLEVSGVRADRREYRTSSYTFWHVREAFATFNAYIDLWITHPLPVLGKQEPIF